MKSIDEAPYLDFFTPEFEANPTAAMAKVRAQSCLARTPIGAVVAVEDLRPSMRALTEELVDVFPPAGRCEFMADFADDYPIQMICELLGIPREDHERFGRWANGLTWVLSLELPAHMGEIQTAFEGLGAYLESFIEDRRRVPQDDLVTRLIQAEDGGDRLSPLELRSMIGALLIAIQLEERDLGAVHGERYGEYQRRVPMLIPRIGVVKPAAAKMPHTEVA